jgi:hypothetical protein
MREGLGGSHIVLSFLVFLCFYCLFFFVSIIISIIKATVQKRKVITGGGGGEAKQFVKGTCDYQNEMKVRAALTPLVRDGKDKTKKKC